MKRTYGRSVMASLMTLLMVLQQVPTWALDAQPQQQKIDLTGGKSLPVDLKQGALVLISKDLTVGNDRPALEISRIYRSDLVQAKPGLFGWKWHTLADMTVVQTGESLQLVDEAGRLRTYAKQSDGSFVSTRYGYEVIRLNSDGGYIRQLKNELVQQFDNKGQFTEMRDLNGRFIRINRVLDGKDTIVRLEDRYGRKITMTLNTDGRVIRMVDAAGRTCQYGYDDKQNLAVYQSRAGGRVEFAYDSSHQLTEIRGGGPQYQIQYKDQRVAEQKMVHGAASATLAEYQYEDGKQGVLAVTVRNAAGAETKNEYTADGKVTATDPTGVKDTIWLNERELPVKVLGAGGQTVEVEYDRHFNVTRLNANGAISRFQYDNQTDRLVAVDAPTGKQKLTYDARGNVTSIQNGQGAESRIEWNDQGLVVGVKESTGRSVKLAYDRHGQVTEAVLDDGQRVQYDFTMSGRLSSVTLPTGVKVDYTYDSLDRLVSARNSEGQAVSLERDAMGRVRRVADPSGAQTSFEYNAAGLLTLARDPVGAATKLEYDPTGNLAAFTDAVGNTTRWTFDPAGRVLAEQDATGVQKLATYNGRGQIAETTNARKQKTAYAYDTSGHMTELDLAGDKAAFEYDATGRMTRMRDSDSDYAFSFADGGKIQQVTDGVTKVPVSYEYDAAGRRTKMKTGDDEVAYTYDAHGRLATIKNALGEFAIEYDQFGRRSAMNYPNGTKTTYAYDKLNRLLDLRAIDKAGKDVTRFRYTYDVRGDRIQMIDGEDKVTKYEYDAKGQLVTVTQGEKVTQYEYDSVGNRVSVTVNGVKEVCATGKDNRLLKAGKAVFDYDADGNMVSRTVADGKNYHYTYDAANRLIQAVGPDGKVVYGYAPNGTRVSRTETGKPASRFVFDQADEIASIQDGKSVWTATFDCGVDQPLALRSGSNTGYYHRDGLGSTARLTDPAGNISGQYEYDAFGVPARATSGMSNPFTYTGREWDSVAGSYFYRARFFDPYAGRFLSKDPIGLSQGPTQYAYVINNPVNYTDPTGEWFGWDDLAVVAFGAVKGVGGKFISYLVTGHQSSWQEYVGTAVGGAAGAEAGYYTLTTTGNPWAAAAVEGAVSSGVEDVADYALNGATGVKQDPWNWGKFGAHIVVGAGMGIVCHGIDDIKIPGITSGQGSFAQVTQQITTKLSEGLIHNIAVPTLGKMVAFTTVTTVKLGEKILEDVLKTTVKTTVDNGLDSLLNGSQPAQPLPSASTPSAGAMPSSGGGNPSVGNTSGTPNIGSTATPATTTPVAPGNTSGTGRNRNYENLSK